MSKRPKDPAPKNQATTGDAFAAVRIRIAAGRTMAALKEAKELAKRQPGPDAEVLLAEAYRARIGDLAKAGLVDEARDLLAVASARFPGEAAAWQATAVAAARAGGDLTDLLRAWRSAAEGDAKQKVADELRRAVTDPTQVADSAELAADDPLRLAAQAVALAFREAAAGALSDAAREGLRAVGRRSPLVGWRHLALALDAFHHHDDAACRTLLEQIASDDSVAPAKALLTSLLAVEPLAADSMAARKVALRVTDGLLDIYAPARALTGAGEAKERREAARAVLEGLTARSLRSAARYVGWVRQRRDLDQLIADLDGTDYGSKLFGQGEWLRLTADLDAAQSPTAGVTTWLAWLMPQQRSKDLRPLSDLDLGEVLEHLAPLALAAQDQILELLGSDFLEALEDPAQMDAQIDAYLEAKHPTSEEDRAITAASFMAHALGRLRRRVGLPMPLPGALGFLDYALALEPTPERGSAGWSALRVRGSTQARAYLARWREALPGDVEPLVQTALLEESKGGYAQSLQLLQEAAARDAVDERVRAARVRVRLRLAQDLQQRGDAAGVRNQLDELGRDAGAQTPMLRTLVAAFRAAALADSAALETAVTEPERRAAVLALAKAALEQGAPRVATFGSGRAERLANLAGLVRIALAGHIHLQAFAAWSEPVTADDLPPSDVDRHALCAFADITDNDQLLGVAAGRGLMHDGPLLAQFLRFRAVAALAEQADSSRVRALAKLAHHYAQRNGDAETAATARELFEQQLATSRAALESKVESMVDGKLELDLDLEELVLDPTAAHRLLAEQRQREYGVRTYVAPSLRQDSASSTADAPSSS